MKKLSVGLILLAFALSSSLAEPAGQTPDNVLSTVVRAYPNDIKDPAKGGEYTIEIGQEISVDVRGLGAWVKKVSKSGVESESIGKLVSPALDPNGAIIVAPNDWTQVVSAAAMNLCLYIDGRPFNDVLPFKADPHYGELERDSTGCPMVTLKYRLKRGRPVADSSENILKNKQWDNLLTSLYARETWFGNARGEWLEPPLTDLSVGLPGKNGISSYHLSSALNPTPQDNEPHGTSIRIKPYSSGWMHFAMLFLVVSLGIGIWLAVRSDLIRDTSAIPNPGGRFPFSLGRCQLAVWTFVVLGSYLFIWLSTDDYNRMEIQAVGLLGISAATGLGAVAVNRLNPQTGSAASKLSPAELEVSTTDELEDLIKAERAKLIALPVGDAAVAGCEARISELRQRRRYLKSRLTPFFTDILIEDHSISIHRFQLAVWTVVVAIVFIRSVFENLQMPVFDSTILILMGISGGTYIGFKFPAQPAE